MIIVGILGRAGDGKSLVADHLVAHYGAKKVAFADPLKDLVRAAFDLREEQVRGTQAEKEAVDPRYSLSGRQLMQRVGEAARNVFGDAFWLREMSRRLSIMNDDDVVVIEDVRQVNESRWCRSGAISVWRVRNAQRASVADGSHRSEREVDSCDYDELLEEGTVEGQLARADVLMRQLLSRR